MLDITSPQTCHATGCPSATAGSCPCNKHSTYRKKVKQELDAESPGYWCDFVVAGSAKALGMERTIRDAKRIDEWAFVTRRQFADDSAEFARSLPPDIDFVVAIWRSGAVPGEAVAAHRHLPYWTVSRHTGVTNPGHGGRMENRPFEEPKHVLLIDDTVASGREMRECLPIVRQRFPDARITRAAVYVRPDSAGNVDAFHAIYPGIHYLSWNVFNAGHGENCGLDWDGILNRECLPEEDDDGERYANFLRTAEPLYLPRRLPVQLIVTARHEKYRATCLEWLDKWGVRLARPESLVMRDFEYDHARRIDQVAEFKAKHYAASGCHLFAESEEPQARIINEITGRPVLCPAAGKVFPAERPLPPIGSQLVNFAGAMLGHARSGFAMADAETQAARLAICEGCPDYRQSDKRCSRCGCGMSGKVKLASSVCPIGKW